MSRLCYAVFLRPPDSWRGDSTGRGAAGTLTSGSLSCPRRRYAVIDGQCLARNGMTSLALTWRLHEIGIRLALGASRWNVMRLFVRESMVFTTIGVVLGVALTWVAAGFLKAVLFAVDPHDVTLFTVVPLSALVLGAACAGIATLKILRVDARAALLDTLRLSG